MDKPKVSVVLFNLGGPDSPETVKPFLFNLFNDPAIIRLPNPFRYLLAKLISTKRAPVAQDIYAEMGGGSPLVPLTRQQADALGAALADVWNVHVTLAMRYWHPLTEAAVEEVQNFAPDHIILLPLYPQFSTSTTGSSLKAWWDAAKSAGLDVPTSAVCCYPTQSDFVVSHAKLISEAFEKAKPSGEVRILFSAHGLPEKFVQDGDPYQWQVEQTVGAVLGALKEDHAHIDYTICYQSKVGRMKWIGPSTDDEIIRAGKEGLGVVVVPIAFVSEHSETLVELDMEYKELAEKHGVTLYARVAALGVDTHYIQALAKMCQEVYGKASIQPGEGVSPRLCPPDWSECPCKIS